MADTERLTRKTDIAFWLHLLAAPLIVQPLMFGFLGGVSDLDAPRAVGILAIFFGLGLVAVIIDRRAFLVSALAYAGFAFGALIQRSGIQEQATPATLLALGVFVLAISAGWRPLRHAALRLLPQDSDPAPSPSSHIEDHMTDFSAARDRLRTRSFHRRPARRQARRRHRPAQPLAASAPRRLHARRGLAEKHPDDRPDRLRQDRDFAPPRQARGRAVSEGRGDEIHRSRLCRPRCRADHPRSCRDGDRA